MGKVYLMLLLLAILATHSTVNVTLNSIVTFILDNLTLPSIQIWDITINLQLQRHYKDISNSVYFNLVGHNRVVKGGGVNFIKL